VIIEDLKIIGFRNLKDYFITFSPRGNLIHGRNGAGKTSILEAIFLLAFGKSFLNRKKSQLINYQSEEFSLRLTTIGYSGKNSISGFYQHRYSLTMDQKKSNLFEVNSYLYPVFFSSADYNLYIENSPYTRKMIDRFIFGVDALYLRYLLSYNRGLKQKNQLLKTTQNTTELRSWNKILSELAEKLVGIKMNFIDMLNFEMKKKFLNRLDIRYKPSLKVDVGVSENIFFKHFETLMQKEKLYKRTLSGPHLDRFDICLDAKPLNLYSSGEKKINLLMIYISFIECFKKIKNQYPVFLVDDFDTAIDDHNIDFLIDHYPEMQVIATSVNENRKFDHMIRLNKEN
jgi:DNA replication and repair protein RecF